MLVSRVSHGPDDAILAESDTTLAGERAFRSALSYATNRQERSAVFRNFSNFSKGGTRLGDPGTQLANSE